MVELNDMIIKYIDSVYEVKGDIIVHSFGTRVYFDEIHKHITATFNLDEFVAIGYMITCFSDTELDYDMFVLHKRPLTWLDLMRMDEYVMGVDPAMGDDQNVINHIVLHDVVINQGYQPTNDDVIDAMGFAVMNMPPP